jgi:hypothetical protein
VTERAPREYAEVSRARYQRADKGERRRILDEYCRPTGCHSKVSEGVRESFWLQGMMAGFPAAYVCIKAFSETDQRVELAGQHGIAAAPPDAHVAGRLARYAFASGYLSGREPAGRPALEHRTRQGCGVIATAGSACDTPLIRPHTPACSSSRSAPWRSTPARLVVLFPCSTSRRPAIHYRRSSRFASPECRWWTYRSRSRIHSHRSAQQKRDSRSWQSVPE